MKKSTKLIAMLTAIALFAGLAAGALADDKIFTSETFSIPKERLKQEIIDMLAQRPEQEAAGAPEEETVPEPTEDPWDIDESEEPADPDEPVERQVLIRSSRGDEVIENQFIELTSKLIGFDGVEVHYQWQVDRGDGAGWVDVEGAIYPKHSFVATKETILYSWRLIISVDD